MSFYLKKIWFACILFLVFFNTYSQNSEILKVAMVHKIANCVVWKADTSKYFTIGVVSTNEDLLNKFKELAKIAKVNKQKIRIIPFQTITSVTFVHLLYVEKIYNHFFSNVSKKISKWNTLLISEEYQQVGEIMANLKEDKKTKKLSFEYNRANILFAGLELTEQIVLLKGTEIEIRELYLRAKKLWDEQKQKTDSLEIQTEIKEKRLKVKSDSINFATKRITENEQTIHAQNRAIAQKDSISAFLHKNIETQNNEIGKNRKELGQFSFEVKNYITQVSDFKTDIKRQQKLSDSLAQDILQKKRELAERKKALGEKEIIINKQSNWLLFLILIISIICILVFFILKAYINNKKAKEKIAEQKEELLTTLEKLQNTQYQLIQSEKMASLGVLVAGIAHEINNPVNFINSGISGIEKVVNKILILLKELNRIMKISTTTEIKELEELQSKLQLQKSIEKMPGIIENVKIGINRTIAIIDGLRLYTHVDKEEKVFSDINQIIQTSLLLLKPKIKDQIEIHTNFEDLSHIPVFPSKLSQVFVNIISNAIDSVMENEMQSKIAKIEISSKEQNNKIIIEISDTGNGISPEILNKIFDPFFTTKEVGKGTGLGLSISYGIIAEHNGKIFARNKEENGAVFTIELPVNE